MTHDHLNGIEPTLFLGLGGTGAKILSAIKAELNLSGYTPNHPLQFLVLDTDKLGTGASRLDPQAEFQTLSQFNPRHYLNEHLNDRESDLSRWFDKDTREHIEDTYLRDGASRIRILGRLCLHRWFHTVEKRIADKIQDARSIHTYDPGRANPEFAARPFRAVIVSSTCGGTGSAIFLDVLYMVNRLLRGTLTPEVTAYLSLPFWFIEMNRQRDPGELVSAYRANAWAFFQELNHIFLEPSQLARIAIRPSHGTAPRDTLADKDYEPLKMAYLLGDEVPGAGRLDTVEDWSIHAAKCITRSAVYRENGSLQSLYSNVKGKLAEIDQRHGLKKRFASVGVSEIRYRDGGETDEMVQDWITEVLRTEAHRPADPNAVAKAVDELRLAIQTRLSDVAADLEQIPAPRLQQKDFQTDREVDFAKFNNVQTRIDIPVSDYNTRLGELSSLNGAVAEVERRVKERLKTLELGVGGEMEVLEQLFRDLHDANPEMPRPDSVHLRLDTPFPEFPSVQKASARSGFRLSWKRSKGPDPQIAALQRWLKEVNQQLGEHAAEAKAAKLEASRRFLYLRIGGRDENGRWVDPITNAPSVLGSARERLLHVREAVSSDRDRRAGRVDGAPAQPSPTTILFPLDGPGLASVTGDLHPVAGAVEALKHRVNPNGTSDVPERTLQQEIRRQLRLTGNLTDDLAAAAASDERLRNALAELQRLSSPTCVLDESKLAAGEEPSSALVAGGITDEIKQHLKLAHPPADAGDERTPANCVWLLQVQHGFPSAAVMGMEDLREDYEKRNRKRSFPHISDSWNKHGVPMRRRDPIAEADLLLFARVRAISEYLEKESGSAASQSIEAGGSAGEREEKGDRKEIENTAAPLGFRVVAAPREERSPTVWLLHYRANGDGPRRLEGRGIVPMEDRRHVWQLTDDRLDLNDAQVERNISAYARSRICEQHRRLLETTVDPMERGNARKQYRAIYEAYAGRLSSLRGTWSRDGASDSEILLLEQIEDTLRRHIERLRPQRDDTL